MTSPLLPALLVISCSLHPALGASARPEAELDKWLEGLNDPDPFVSKLAEAEVRNLGEDVLLPLAKIVAAGPVSDAAAGRLRWLRVEKILREILSDFFIHLESEYRALELDRQELEFLDTRLESLSRLKELRGRISTRESENPGVEANLKSWLAWRRLRESAVAAAG